MTDRGDCANHAHEPWWETCDRRRLADAVPDADGHGAGDHWIQPSLFDADSEGAVSEGEATSKRDGGPRVGRSLVILTRGEIENKRQRVLDQMRVLQHLDLDHSQTYADLVDELDDCDFLLGDR